MTEITIPHEIILQSQLRRLHKAHKRLSSNDPYYDQKTIELLESEITLLKEENKRLKKLVIEYVGGEC